MTRTSSVVTLEVAKQGAIYHGLATLLNQPSPMMQRRKHCWGGWVSPVVTAHSRPAAASHGPVPYEQDRFRPVSSSKEDTGWALREPGFPCGPASHLPPFRPRQSL